jgi:pimeloyl-ACP methyl ester carboxylesterase
LRLFGFSGGGQFAHRYALFYPRRVARQVLGAPGWYTFPDPEHRYPLGLRTAPPEWPKLTFNPGRFLRIPTLVLVGEHDNRRDRELNRTRQVDVHQGLDRMERAPTTPTRATSQSLFSARPSSTSCSIDPGGEGAPDQLPSWLPSMKFR